LQLEEARSANATATYAPIPASVETGPRAVVPCRPPVRAQRQPVPVEARVRRSCEQTEGGERLLLLG
jgi:hypothetical protein